MHKLVLIRHGESTWNLENRFTGWTDVDLTATGVEQAKQAGRLLQGRGLRLRRLPTPACSSAPPARCGTCLDEMDRTWLPVVHSWRLNERHYGALQGLNKAETAKKYGDEQVLVWRRSYDTPPPPLEAGRPAQRARRPALRQAGARADAADRMPEGHGGARAAVLERVDGAGHPRRASGVRGGRARQLDPRAGEVPRRHLRRATSSA